MADNPTNLPVSLIASLIFSQFMLIYVFIYAEHIRNQILIILDRGGLINDFYRGKFRIYWTYVMRSACLFFFILILMMELLWVWTALC